MASPDAVGEVDARFREGLELFNRGEFYECHEVIEGLWLEVRDAHRDLYKGVIQAAAALYQYRRGIWSGALGLHRTSLEYLRPYAPASLGLDVGGLIGQLEAFFAPLESWDGRGDPPPFEEGRVPKAAPAADEASR